MVSRIKNSLIFRIKEFMMQGGVARFGLLLLLVVPVSLVTGALDRQIAPCFDSIGDAIWWVLNCTQN